MHVCVCVCEYVCVCVCMYVRVSIFLYYCTIFLFHRSLFPRKYRLRTISNDSYSIDHSLYQSRFVSRIFYLSQKNSRFLWLKVTLCRIQWWSNSKQSASLTRLAILWIQLRIHMHIYIYIYATYTPTPIRSHPHAYTYIYVRTTRLHTCINSFDWKHKWTSVQYMFTRRTKSLWCQRNGRGKIGLVCFDFLAYQTVLVIYCQFLFLHIYWIYDL